MECEEPSISLLSSLPAFVNIDRSTQQGLPINAALNYQSQLYILVKFLLIFKPR
jgi:hypothetical protein